MFVSYLSFCCCCILISEWHFDGWLINIENIIDVRKRYFFVKWAKALRVKINRRQTAHNVAVFYTLLARAKAAVDAS